jgi:hypothetical protein
MGTSGKYDPSQAPSLHRDKKTFDDPVRKVGPDATADFDNSRSNPTERASSEALTAAVPDPASNPSRADELNRRARPDALDTGIDDADRDDSVIDPDDDVLDDEEISDDDESLVDENGVKKIR